jgi:hypothetical protein
LEFHSLGFAE